MHPAAARALQLGEDLGVTEADLAGLEDDADDWFADAEEKAD